MSARTIRSIAAVTLLKGVGVLLSVAIAAAIAGLFGATATTDAFFLARRAVMNVAAVLERSVHLVMVPPMVQRAETDETEGLREGFARTARRVILLAAGPAILAAVFAPQIVAMLAPGFDEARAASSVFYFRILVLTLPVSAYAAVSGAMFNAVRRFSLPAFARLLPRLFSLSALTVLALLPLTSGMSLVVWATAAGIAAMGVVLMWAARGAFAEPSPTGTGAAPVKETPPTVGAADKTVSGKRFLVLMLGQIHMLASSWIDMAFASTTGPGNVATLEFAQRLVNVGPGAAIGSVMVVYYTELASARVAGDNERFRQNLIDSVRTTVFMVLPVAIALFFLSGEFVGVLFSHGAFGRDTAEITARIVAMLAPLVIVNALVTNLFAAILADPEVSQARVLLVAVIGSLLVRLGIDAALIDDLGLLAVPLASLISGAVPLALIHAALTRQTGTLLRRGDIAPFLKIAAAAAALAAVLTAVAALGSAWADTKVAQVAILAAGLGAGALTYLAAAFGLGLPETRIVTHMLRKKFRAGKSRD